MSSKAAPERALRAYLLPRPLRSCVEGPTRGCDRGRAVSQPPDRPQGRKTALGGHNRGWHDCGWHDLAADGMISRVPKMPLKGARPSSRPDDQQQLQTQSNWAADAAQPPRPRGRPEGAGLSSPKADARTTIAVKGHAHTHTHKTGLSNLARLGGDEDSLTPPQLLLAPLRWRAAFAAAAVAAAACHGR